MVPQKLAVLAILCRLVFINTDRQIDRANVSMPETLTAQLFKATSRLQYDAEIVLEVIRCLNWTSITVFTDPLTEGWPSVLKALTNDTLLRINVISELDRTNLSYHNNKGVFTDNNAPLYVVICPAECVQKIFDLVIAEVTENFLFSSKWLIVTNNILPLTSVERFQNLAFIYPQAAKIYLPSCTKAVTTLKVDGDTKTLTQVPQINICEKKAYTERMYRESVFPNLYNGLGGRTVRIGVAKWDPYLMKLSPAVNGTVKYVGLGVDIMEALEMALNFRAKYVESPDKSNEWQTLVKMVQNTEIDIIAAPFILSKERSEAMDFTYPVVFQKILAFYSLPRDVDLQWRLLVDILSWPVIVITFLSLLCTGVMLCVFQNSHTGLPVFQNSHTGLSVFQNSHKELSKKNHQLIFDDVWFLFGNLLNQGQSFYIRKAKWMSTRLVVSAWCMFCLILTVTFTAHLVPSLGVNKRPILFRTLKDLINHGNYIWGTYGDANDALMNYFKNAFNKDHQEIYRQMLKFNETDSEVFGKTFDVIERKILSENYAFIFTDEPMQSIYARHCELVYINEKLDEFPIAFPMLKHSAYSELFSKWILYFTENGQLGRWRQKWTPSRQCSVKKTKSTSMTLSHTQSVFILIACGIVMSVIALFLEVVIHVCKSKNQKVL